MLSLWSGPGQYLGRRSCRLWHPGHYMWSSVISKSRTSFAEYQAVWRIRPHLRREHCRRDLGHSICCAVSPPPSQLLNQTTANDRFSSGCKVIATASSRNFSLLKSLGAEEVFDYKDPSCAQKIRDHTSDTLTLALDCISEGSSPTICEQAISTKGGTITFLLKSAKNLVTRPESKRNTHRATPSSARLSTNWEKTLPRSRKTSSMRRCFGN